ncbi:MAG: glycosyltransferase family 4 protein [Acidimicrobiales bacterium]
MRVAIVSAYALSVFGGVQEQSLAMSRELTRRGHDVLIVAPDGHDRARYDTPAHVARFGVVLKIPANGSRAPLTLSPAASRHAARTVAHFRPDVVHFHEPFAPLIGWGVLRAHDAAAVATFHRGGGGPALTLTKPLLRRLATQLDESAAVSESAAATIHAACGLEPVVLFNGFEIDRFAATPRERGEVTTLVVLGRHEERKGVAHAINAVRAHNAKGEDTWQLVVVGDGPQRRVLESLAAGDPAIVFVGAAGDEEKRRWLRRANALIAPSTGAESFGMVVLEGMASETSVVASDIDGYREAAAGLATMFTPGDDTSLEAAIERALRDETPESIARARAHASEWSIAALMDRYEALYARARERFSATR